MEGLFETVVSPRVARPTLARTAAWPGYLAAAAVGAIAYALHALPIAPFTIIEGEAVRHPISAAMIAIVLGLVVRNTLALPGAIKAGCKSAIRKLIPVAIVLTGAGLNFTAMATVGIRALFIIVICIALALVAGYYIGRMLGLSPRTSMLLGAGTGICGNSAIVAVAPLIDAEDDDIVLSVGTVNLLGLVAMLLWPILGTWFALSSEAFGVWAGVSIHAVPQVVAAGFAFTPDAGAMATLVKLVRVAFLAPLVCVLALYYARRRKEAGDPEGGVTVRYTHLVPWFVWGFVFLALCNTMGFIPTLVFEPSGLVGGNGGPVDLRGLMKWTSELLLTWAMAAIGLEVSLRQLASVGGNAIAAGTLATIVLGGGSLCLILLAL
jgi:uncharacterized integral membrane protein (TIGR00698 family)